MKIEIIKTTVSLKSGNFISGILHLNEANAEINDMANCHMLPKKIKKFMRRDFRTPRYMKILIASKFGAVKLV